MTRRGFLAYILYILHPYGEKSFKCTIETFQSCAFEVFQCLKFGNFFHVRVKFKNTHFKLGKKKQS